MVDIVTRVNNVVNGFVWGPFGLALLFCTGFWMSARTGFFQFRKMGYWLRHTIGAIFTNKDVTAHTSKEDMAISQFQSMCTALAGTIGTGNIVGVATAIVLGVGRAIGETMAVIMIAGNQPRIPDSLLEGVRTLTGNIVMEMGYAQGLHREALIATGVVLFVFILIINLLFSILKRKESKA